MNSVIDPSRLGQFETGIYIRAKHPDTGAYGSYDIGELDKASLKEWLLSRNDTQWMLDVVGIILGHGHFKD